MLVDDHKFSYPSVLFPILEIIGEEEQQWGSERSA